MNLDQLESLKFPLRYGTDRCSIVLGDSRYSEQIVGLRNDPEVNACIHQTDLTVSAHEAFMQNELAQRDRLNFAILIDGRFCGTAGLYNIRPGISAEYGRLVMLNDSRRIFVLGVEFLVMSFGFEILGLPELSCNVVAENAAVVRLHLANGWKQDARYSSRGMLNGKEVSHIGFSIGVNEWPAAFGKMRPLLRRLLVP